MCSQGFVSLVITATDILGIRHVSIIQEEDKTVGSQKDNVCEKKRCVLSGDLITSKEHECYKQLFETWKQNRETGHLWYVRPLRKELPPSEGVLFEFYDFETTQDIGYYDSSTGHIPKLVYTQKFCSLCENL